MLLFVIGVLLIIVGIITLITSRKRNTEQKIPSGLISVVAIIAGIFCIGSNCITTIPTGHTGIITTFGKVEDFTLEAGVHIKAPWQEAVKMDNRIQKAAVEMNCFSSDIQEVSTSYTINYQIEKSNAQKIYSTIGQDYYNTVILPRIQESVKSQISNYDAENLISSREKLSNEIKKDLTTKLSAYNIELIDASIENLDFSDAFTDAVEAKQVASQEKLKAEIQQEQANMEAQRAAERAIISAKAEAEKAVIDAEARAEVLKKEADAAAYAGEKEAEANAAIAASLTSDLISYKNIEKWNGELPQIVGSGEAVPILNMNEKSE